MRLRCALLLVCVSELLGVTEATVSRSRVRNRAHREVSTVVIAEGAQPVVQPAVAKAEETGDDGDDDNTGPMAPAVDDGSGDTEDADDVDTGDVDVAAAATAPVTATAPAISVTARPGPFGPSDPATALRSTASAPVTVEVKTATAPVPGVTMESLTPDGKVRLAREALQENLRQQADTTVEISQFTGEESAETFNSMVDKEAERVKKEAQSQALATMLGSMRKQMRQFAEPFYLQHLLTEQNRSKAAEQKLEANLNVAMGAKAAAVHRSQFGGAVPAAPAPAAPAQLRGQYAVPVAPPGLTPPVHSAAVDCKSPALPVALCMAATALVSV